MALSCLHDRSCKHIHLASPRSSDSFADAFLKSNGTLDILIHNAGIFAPPLTRDERGYEIQFATNHPGHFQLTERLWNPLNKSGSARLVTYSSIGHSVAGMDFNDPNFNNRPYDKWVAYGQSKTATSLFAVEFGERAQAYGIRGYQGVCRASWSGPQRSTSQYVG